MELDQLDLRDGGGVYKSTRDGVTVEVPFAIDISKIDPARRHDSERIGQTDDGVIVLLDRYASRASPDGHCANGIESYVRAFSLQERKEVFAALAESCLSDKAGPDAEVAWEAPSGFRVGEQRYAVQAQKVVPLAT
ncbi:hypothetical protein LK533_15160 [Sphingomonas sp. PL-96]|uniref:hypothetical protein n=1 Tax=Sphingomonas sp. PL-96 TaxID=2887201 RepID=UPI001E34CF36|nr:hypothetical protein [Sphingomonas sp. PL-96]MCC2978002.1 hypothetical protein [Sphingomonas sp. PL-96]